MQLAASVAHATDLTTPVEVSLLGSSSGRVTARLVARAGWGRPSAGMGLVPINDPNGPPASPLCNDRHSTAT